jgi:hypothetical protein
MTEVIPEHVKRIRGKLNQLRQAKGGRMAQRPNDGYVWNPLRDLPPNMACPCKSGAKFKKCCGPLTSKVISKNWVDAWNKAKDVALDGGQAW